MSVPHVATSISLRRLVPGAVSAQPSSVAVRWLLCATTLVVFGLATVIGVSLGLGAPSESPVSISEPRR